MPNFLIGHKTYLLAALGAIVTFAYTMGWIERTTWEAILGFVAAGGMATMRAGVATVAQRVEQGQAVATHQVAQVQADVAHVAAVVEGTPVMPPPPRVLRREP